MSSVLQFPGLLLFVAFFITGGNVLANEFHPAFPLLDQAGKTVIESGEPLSTMTTCGGCHDTVFIASSSDHADAGAQQMGRADTRHDWQAGPGYFAGWDPLR